MVKMYLKWSELTKEQREQVKTFYARDIEKGFLLNKMLYQINPKDGRFKNHYISQFNN